MKTAAIVSSFVLVVAPIAHAVTVEWKSDSYSAFDVAISGTSLDWDGAITSPSGLWHLSAQNRGAYLPNAVADRPINMSTYGELAFLGEIPTDVQSDAMSTPVYNDFLSPSVPLRSTVTWAGLGFDGNQAWQGLNALVITSIPNLEDASTWTWSAKYSASGPSLKPVPESGSGAAYLGLAALVIFVTKAMDGFSSGRRSTPLFGVPLRVRR